MMSVHKLVGRWPAVTVLAVLIVSVGCSGSGDDPVDVPPALAERSAESLQVVRNYEATWTAHDLRAMASLLDDQRFVFNEPGRTNMSKTSFVDLMEPYMEMETIGSAGIEYFVGGDEVVQSSLVWGFGGATEQAPIVEVDLYVVDGGRITSLRSLYGPPEWTRRHALVLPTGLLDRYVDAWSSTDSGVIEALYAETAVRSEPLYDVVLPGPAEISGYAVSFHERHPGVTLSPVEPFIFGHQQGDSPVATIGAVLGMADGSGCEVRSLVLLDSDGSGSITAERIYHDIETIKACAWER